MIWDCILKFMHCKLITGLSKVLVPVNLNLLIKGRRSNEDNINTI